MAGQGLPNKKRKETAKMALYRESVTKVPSNPFPNSSTAVVIMNGESRQGFDLEKLRKKDLAIFGCNAIYRTFPVDFLVAVDINMAREINDSGYAHKHEFWSYPRAKVKAPPAIKFPTDWGWSTGPTTVRLAIMKGFKNIYILGMDFGSPTKKINNIYKGTKNYRAPTHDPIFTGNWENQIRTNCKDVGPECQFFRVGSKEVLNLDLPPKLQNLPNLRDMSYPEFESHINKLVK